MLLFLFINYWLILLIPVIIALIFYCIAELVIPIGIPRNTGKAEIEIHTLIVEDNKKVFNII